MRPALRTASHAVIQRAKSARKRRGLWQMLALQLGDGRWMTDSTKMIQWFEARYPQNGLLPEDPVQRLMCLLLLPGQEDRLPFTGDTKMVGVNETLITG